MKLEIQQGLKPFAEATTLVLFVSQPKSDGKEAHKTPLCHNLPAELKKLFTEAVTEKTVTGGAAEFVFFRNHSHLGYKHVLFAGVGAWDGEDHETLRSVGGSLEGVLGAHKVTGAVLDLSTMNKALSAPLLQALAEGLGLAAYRFDELMTAKKDKPKEIKVALALPHLTKAHNDAFENAQILIESVSFSRRLGDMPGNLMTPTILAEETKKAAKGTKIKVTIWDKARIKKERMGGLLCVAQGSEEEPRFIIMEYKGGKANQKPVAFVGKGLTFDTGGISIKPGAGMEEMKYDMCGGANVIGAILAIAKMKLKVNVVAFVPSTENMCSGSAIKPGDIVRARNGKTYEVNNTDAEGRLILSDALTVASEMKPQVIVDAATLTGAMVIALGNTHTGYFTKDAELKAQIEEAAKASGEWVWQMPLCDFHTKDMKGTFADLSNLAAGRGAGSATAAAFLEQFVEKGIPWAHFDIAGTGWATGSRLTYTPKKGASGVMIRTFVELAKQYV
jgi:leucyl aminopeptidase